MKSADALALELERCSVALLRCRLTSWERRELEGAAHALAWALGSVETWPTAAALPLVEFHKLPGYVADLARDVETLHGGDMDMAAPLEKSRPGATARAGAGFMELSQPRSDR